MMEPCYFTEEFERMSLAGACHSQRAPLQASRMAAFAAHSPPRTFQAAPAVYQQQQQQQHPSPATSPTGMRKKPRLLTVTIPNGITDDTNADAYQRSMLTPTSVSPQTPWRIGSDSETDMQ